MYVPQYIFYVLSINISRSKGTNSTRIPMYINIYIYIYNIHYWELASLIEHWNFEKSDLGLVWKHDLVYFQTYLKCCVFFKLFWKTYPQRRLRRRPRALPRPGKGYFFQTSLKNTQHFKYVWKYTKSCFQTCPKSDFSNFQCSMRDASYQFCTDRSFIALVWLWEPKGAKEIPEGRQRPSQGHFKTKKKLKKSME